MTKSVAFVAALSAVFLLSSCLVSKTKYDELDSKYKREQSENRDLKKANKEKDDQIEALKATTETLSKELKQDKEKIDKLKEELDEMRQSYNDLVKRRQQESQASAEKTDRLLDEQKRLEDRLDEKERELNEKEAALKEKDERLSKLQSELRAREKRVAELERILAEKDSAVNALRNRISKALRFYEDKGLSVTVKNGKVYVSMEEKLLFESGKYSIDPQGKKALLELAKVLRDQQGVTVMVEGHTDNKPYNGRGQIEDNLDLSVKRATTVTRILTEDGQVDPERIIAAGRGEHLPVATNETPEGRAKNRRTEIILTPELDRLFDILNSN